MNTCVWILPRYRQPFVRKCAFDVGDYGLGYTASSLSLGCDCLGVIKYFDAVWANPRGEPVVLKKVGSLTYNL